MRKRIKSGMIEFARELGAMRGKQTDWYAVAEHLSDNRATGFTRYSEQRPAEHREQIGPCCTSTSP